MLWRGFLPWCLFVLAQVSEKESRRSLQHCSMETHLLEADETLLTLCWPKTDDAVAYEIQMAAGEAR